MTMTDAIPAISWGTATGHYIDGHFIDHRWITDDVCWAAELLSRYYGGTRAVRCLAVSMAQWDASADDYVSVLVDAPYSVLGGRMPSLIITEAGYYGEASAYGRSKRWLADYADGHIAAGYPTIDPTLPKRV
jgi:hypothetical protein